MTALNYYNVGTVSIALNGTTATFAGGTTLLTNARADDTLIVDGYGPVDVVDVTDNNHVVIDKWPYAAVSGAAYKIRQNGLKRYSDAEISDDVVRLTEDLDSLGYIIFVSAVETVPNPRKGDEDQLAFQYTTNRWWKKTAGVWTLYLLPGQVVYASTLGLLGNGASLVDEAFATARDYCVAHGVTLVLTDGVYKHFNELSWAYNNFHVMVLGDSVAFEHTGTGVAHSFRGIDTYPGTQGAVSVKIGGPGRITFSGNTSGDGGTTVLIDVDNCHFWEMKASLRNAVTGLRARDTGLVEVGSASVLPTFDLVIASGSTGQPFANPMGSAIDAEKLNSAVFTKLTIDNVGNGGKYAVDFKACKGTYVACGTIESCAAGGLREDSDCARGTYINVHNEFNGTGHDWDLSGQSTRLINCVGNGTTTGSVFNSVGTQLDAGNFKNLVNNDDTLRSIGTEFTTAFTDNGTYTTILNPLGDASVTAKDNAVAILGNKVINTGNNVELKIAGHSLTGTTGSGGTVVMSDGPTLTKMVVGSGADPGAGYVNAQFGYYQGDVLLRNASEALANKSIDAASNTITNITLGMFASGVVDTDSTLSASSAAKIAPQSAVKSYVDNAVTGLSWKQAVGVATTANITLSGEQTIDGVLTSGSRVLAKNQTTASQNGIYVSGAGAWVRAVDMDSGAEFPSATVLVKSGTVNGDTQWTCTNDAVTVGTTAVAFAQVSGAGTYSAGSGLTLTGNQFSVNGSQVLTSITVGGVADPGAGYVNVLNGYLLNGTLLKNVTETLTNKSVSLGSNTVTGTTAQFNTALSDNDFATLAGSEALTNKTLNGNTFTSGTYTLTGAAGKTFTFSNTITLAGTDGTTMTMPSTTATIARTDAGQTFTGTQVFSSTINGSISGTAAVGSTVTIADDTSTNATVYLAWFGSTSGNLVPKISDTKLTFNPFTGVLSSTSFAGAGTGLTGLTTGNFATNVVDTDGTLAANSDTRVASQKAVKTYADALIAANDAMVFKGVIDCSANPNYPAADRGHTYKVSVAGKIGGASGTNVEVGDTLLCITDGTAAGTQAVVGAQWNVVQANLDGAVIGPASATDATPVVFDGASGKLIKNVTFASFKTSLSLAKADVGLGSVDNTADSAKSVASAAILTTARNIDGQSFDGSLAITVVAPGTHAATGKTTPVDADELPIVDTAASNVLKKLTFANLKNFLQTYLDTLYFGTNSNVLLHRGYLSGLGLSAAGSTATFGIAAGVAADSTNASMLLLASSYTKTTGSWAVGTGNGAMDAGTVANSTWYHVHLIKRVDTGVVDVLFSLSATAPTLPTNYTLSRRMGAMKTDGSAQWVKFIQDGDRFRWAAAVRDVNSTNPGTSAVTRALASVPLGVRVQADVSVDSLTTNGSPGLGAIYVSDLLQDDVVASASNFTLSVYNDNLTAGHTFALAAPVSVMTDTSQQIRTRCAASAADISLLIVTHGWTDRRGRDG